MKFAIFLLVSFIGVMGMALKLTFDTSMVFRNKNADLEKQNKILIHQNQKLKLKQAYNKRESRKNQKEN